MRTFAAIALAIIFPMTATAAELRVCADPNNLPFSNTREEGFENKIAALLARELHINLRYVWWAQRRGYVRNTLKEGRCDIWPGIAADVASIAPIPYYRSTYVFVTRADRGIDISSLDDPRLKTLAIGVQLVGDDAFNTPPAQALARRGIVDNVRGIMIFGDHSSEAPAARIVDAVAKGDVDIAAVWGPVAGYFASRETRPLRLSPVQNTDPALFPMQFEIAIGVRRDNAELKARIAKIVARSQEEIRAILAAYHVPIIPLRAAH
jgi:mxaJ protein